MKNLRHCFMVIFLSIVFIGGVFSDPIESRHKRQTPVSFDASVQWPECSHLINFVYADGQGECRSSAAMSVASAISDRICIFSEGETDVLFSAQDVIECCSDCQGCNGGDPLNAWRYWVDGGLPTGGDRNSRQGCKPYTVPTTGSPPQRCTPRCSGTNDQTKYYQEIQDYRGMSYFMLKKNNVLDIQREIMKNGPVVAMVISTADFMSFSGTGIFQQISTISFGFQAVKIIGWGSIGNVPYWQAIAAYGTGWGDNGQFKIRRGVDELSIESNSVTAGNYNPAYYDCTNEFYLPFDKNCKDIGDRLYVKKPKPRVSVKAEIGATRGKAGLFSGNNHLLIPAYSEAWWGDQRMFRLRFLGSPRNDITSGDHVIIFSNDACGVEGSIRVTYDRANNRVHARIITGDTAELEQTTNLAVSPINLNIWNNLELRYNGTLASLTVARETDSEFLAGNIAVRAAPLQLGGGCEADNWLIGYIDEFYVFSCVPVLNE